MYAPSMYEKFFKENGYTLFELFEGAKCKSQVCFFFLSACPPACPFFCYPSSGRVSHDLRFASGRQEQQRNTHTHTHTHVGTYVCVCVTQSRSKLCGRTEGGKGGPLEQYIWSRYAVKCSSFPPLLLILLQFLGYM